MKNKLSKEISAIAIIALRDFIKFVRDKMRIVFTFLFPVIFIGALGGSLESNLGNITGYNLMVFVFTGVLAQTMFQSTASGIISLIEDRENDFSQEIFVSPISRYSIVIGKIIGESLVSIAQGVGIIILGLMIGIHLSFFLIIQLFILCIIICLVGGAFGVLIMGNVQSQKTANQIFPLIIFPQFILAGVFNPIKNLPWYLDILSKISPMRYAVDLMRGIYYAGTDVFDKVVLHSIGWNLIVLVAMFFIFLMIGTFMFVRNERNR